MNAIKLLTKPQKITRTSLDTILVTPAIVQDWKSPPFQRPLKVNAKVLALMETIKGNGGVIPGIMTIGVLGNQSYLLDGQHRREAYLMSGILEGYTDVRKHQFDSMGEMGEEFVNINSQLVRLRPDDILRGLEGSMPGIRAIRESCPFVGYDFIRRGTNSPMVSMSAALRAWFSSLNEVPSSGGLTAIGCAQKTTKEEGEHFAAVLKLFMRAWGRDEEYQKLWGALNLTLCLWLYRRLCVADYSAKIKRIDKELFVKGATSLSADPNYLEWLHGRGLTDRDRSPAYNRLKAIFASRILAETGKKQMLPTPAWAHA